MNILIIKKIHSMILSKSTGKPKELALKLNVSERTIYNYIHFMRKDLKSTFYTFSGIILRCFGNSIPDWV